MVLRPAWSSYPHRNKIGFFKRCEYIHVADENLRFHLNTNKRNTFMSMINSIILRYVILLTVLCMSSTLQAEGLIIATVGQDIVTQQDVNRRMETLRRLVPSQANLAESTIKNQSKQLLIDELLFRAEAEKWGIALSNTDRQLAYARIEKQQQRPEGSLNIFLSKQGAYREDMERYVDAQIIWSKLITKRIRPNIVISEQEITQAMEQLSSVTKQYYFRQFYVPTIFLSPRAIAEKKNQIEEVRAQLSHCQDVTIDRAVKAGSVLGIDETVKRMDELPSELNALFEATQENGVMVTPIIQDSESLQLYVLCQVKSLTVQMPSLEQMKERLFQQKITTQSSYYLEQLRRQALIHQEN
jgi:hypothetical protein